MRRGRGGFLGGWAVFRLGGGLRRAAQVRSGRQECRSSTRTLRGDRAPHLKAAHNWTPRARSPSIPRIPRFILVNYPPAPRTRRTGLSPITLDSIIFDVDGCRHSAYYSDKTLEALVYKRIWPYGPTFLVQTTLQTDAGEGMDHKMKQVVKNRLGCRCVML